MKKRFFSMSLIVLAIFAVFSMNNVNAAETYGDGWKRENGNLYLYVDYGAYGQQEGTIDIDIPATKSTNEAGILVGCIGWHYRIKAVNNTNEEGIVTGWVQREYISQDDTPHYDGLAKLKVDALQTGIQDVLIIAENYEGTDWPENITSPTYNNVTVICAYSAKFVEVAGKLGITFTEDNIRYNLNNIKVDPDKYFEDILGAGELYGGLNVVEKNTLNGWIEKKSGNKYRDFGALYDAADRHVTDLANDFITAYDADNCGAVNINEIRANKILSSETAYGQLEEDYVRPRVWGIIKDAPAVKTSGAENYGKWLDYVRDTLYDLNAADFVRNNGLSEFDTNKFAVENHIDILHEGYEDLARSIIDGKIAAEYAALDREAQLKTVIYMGNSFADIQAAAQGYLDAIDDATAQEFYDNYLDGLDEEKIVKGENSWNSFSEIVKGKIDALLNDNDVEETYLELLEKATDKLNEKAAEESNEETEALNEKTAEDSAKNPQTGDLSPIMMVLFVVSVLGIIATRSKKEWHFC